MNGVALIEGKELEWIRLQLIALQQQNLAIMKRLQELMPNTSKSNVPDFISISDACKKYHVSRVTINNKIRLFKKVKGRSIDRLRAGSHKLVNELELQQALAMQVDGQPNFLKKSA